VADLLDQAGRTRAIVESHDLDEVGKPGDRWDGADPATLERILFHLLQEYARHLGHLDIVVELAVGGSGELFSAERTPVRAQGHASLLVGLLCYALVHALAQALDPGA
jgi:Protein of unknown function (DUF664)